MVDSDATSPQSAQALTPIGRGRYLVDGRQQPSVLSEVKAQGRPLDGSVVEALTSHPDLAALAAEKLGRAPQVGDRFRLGGFQSGLDFAVIRCEDGRVRELEVAPVAGNDGTPGTHPRAGSE
ncbi:MAG: hypothetical protein DWQ01_22165 [Planctomycetota bacterium]|nr:MAG: hypothetical protein DWQ01_22165 [Planctomycetota bacterium]